MKSSKPLVDWWGLPFSLTGYGKHTRCMCLNMPDEIDLSVIHAGGDERLSKKGKMLALMRGRRNAYLYDKPFKRDAMELWNLNPYSALLANYPNRSFSDEETFKILLTVYEGESIPSEWVSICEKYNEVWCPSNFALNLFEKACKGPKFRMVPEGVDLETFTPEGNKLLDLPGFTFLSVFDMTYRKGWDVLVKAYCDEFRREEDVTLLIRSYHGAYGPEFVKSQLRKIRENSRYRPRIHLLLDFVAEEDMPSLYRSGSAFVLPSRGEGYGLILFEAAASGLSILTTDYSAPKEFFKPEDVYFIENLGVKPYPLREAIMHEPNCAGIKFADPSVEDCRAKMREVFETDDPKVADVSKFTWKRAARIAADNFLEIWGKIR